MYSIEHTIIRIIAEIKKLKINEIHITPHADFLEQMNFDSFEVVHFVDKLDTEFNIDFGIQSTDFDSLKSWSALITNIKNRI